MPRNPKTGRFTRADDKPVLHRQLTNMDGLPIPQSWDDEIDDQGPTPPPAPLSLGDALWAFTVGCLLVGFLAGVAWIVRALL